MNEQQRIAVFDAQTINVRELEKAWSHTNRQINALLLQKSHKSVEITTKLLALIYCALAEALFSKLIHTPNGLPLVEIEQVKCNANARGVKFGWTKCAELAIRRVEGAKSNHGPNVLKKLSEMIEQYIFDPSLIRNKLAHGQWSVALNRENTAVNTDITNEIDAHTVVELYRRKNALEKLGAILEDIIESPNKAHHRDYWLHLMEFEKQQEKLASWTIEKKIERLFEKKSHARRGV
nr:hypothetical protein [uncultured Pseudogulbenkiania sp.]